MRILSTLLSSAPAFLLITSTQTITAATIRVPADQPTIQAGIDAASESDTVLVAPGTYTGEGNRDLDFQGTNLVLMSEAGPALTTIQGAGGTRALYFGSGESVAAVAEGFTITGGDAVTGAGILCNNGSSPTIKDCRISNCSAYDVGDPNSTDVGTLAGHGGGLACFDASLILIDCVFEANSARDGFHPYFGDQPGQGGAIYAWRSHLDLISCEIRTNESDDKGGGIYLSLSEASFATSYFNDNTAESGGAIYADRSTIDLTECDFDLNTAQSGGAVYASSGSAANFASTSFVNNTATDPEAGDGGAVYSEQGSVDIVDCDFQDNSAFNGGAVNFSQCSASLQDCEFQDNSAYSGGAIMAVESNVDILESSVTGNNGDYGGGLFCSGSQLLAESVAFLANSADTHGGGVFLWESSAEVRSCEFGSNLADLGGAVYCMGNSDPEREMRFESCQFLSNSCSFGGGAMYIRLERALSIDRCLFAGNYSAISPSSVYLQGSTSLIEYSTFVANSCEEDHSDYAAADLVLHGCYAGTAIRNTILAFAAGGQAIACENSAWCLELSSCDFFGNEGGDWTECIADQLGTNGNLSSDPLFCDTALGDYQLDIHSPCAPGVQPNIDPIGAFGVGCGYVQCGDADGNGELTSADLQRLYDFYFGMSDVWPLPVAGGDMDCDGVITIADVILMSGYIYGYGPAPCCDPEPKRPDLPGREGFSGNGE